MAVVDTAWDGSPGRFPDAGAYCDSALINGNTGDRKDWVKSACHLPIREPSGAINKNALSAAAAALAGARGGLRDVSAQDRKSAARKLLAAYREAQMPPPASLKALAS